MLIAGLVLFTALHLLRELRLRKPLIDRLGLRTYRVLFSLAALAAVVLIIKGKSTAPFITLWVPPFNWREAALWLMLPATILLVAGYLKGSLLRHYLVHPVLLAVVLWAFSHLLVNGDLASMLMFSTFLLWALVKLFTLPATGSFGRNNIEVIAGLGWDAGAVLAGMLIYVLLFILHGDLFGMGISIV